MNWTYLLIGLAFFGYGAITLLSKSDDENSSATSRVRSAYSSPILIILGLSLILIALFGS